MLPAPWAGNDGWGQQGPKGEPQDPLPGDAWLGLPASCVWPKPPSSQERLPDADLIPPGWRGGTFLVFGPHNLYSHLREPQRWRPKCREERV